MRSASLLDILGPHCRPEARNGPARLRCREKRVAVLTANAEEDEATLATEEREVLELAEKAENKTVAEKAIVPVEESTYEP